MSAVLDNFDVYLKAFGYTVFLFLVAGVLSMILGTILVALRVGPVAVLRRAAATYVTVVRNTPLVIVFAFFTFVAPDLRDRLQLAPGQHRALQLHRVLRGRRRSR